MMAQEYKIDYARKLSENGVTTYIMVNGDKARIAGSEDRRNELEARGYEIDMVFVNGKWVG